MCLCLKQYSHVPNTVTGECEMDPGGYFIINGSEKTCQERAAENLVQCFNVEKITTNGHGVQKLSLYLMHFTKTD